MGGPNAFELEMLAAINNVRAERGLVPVQMDMPLMMAARFYSQTLSNLGFNLAHNVGPYGGSRPTAESFGARMTWTGGNGHSGGWAVQTILNRWMNSPGHRDFILAPAHRYIGFGSQLGGPHGVFHYLFLSDRYSIPPGSEDDNGDDNGYDNGYNGGDGEANNNTRLPYVYEEDDLTY